jgi:hypothetical protein
VAGVDSNLGYKEKTPTERTFQNFYLSESGFTGLEDYGIPEPGSMVMI